MRPVERRSLRTDLAPVFGVLLSNREAFAEKVYDVLNAACECSLKLVSRNGGRDRLSLLLQAGEFVRSKTYSHLFGITGQ